MAMTMMTMNDVTVLLAFCVLGLILCPGRRGMCTEFGRVRAVSQQHHNAYQHGHVAIIPLHEHRTGDALTCVLRSADRGAGFENSVKSCCAVDELRLQLLLPPLLLLQLSLIAETYPTANKATTPIKFCISSCR